MYNLENIFSNISPFLTNYPSLSQLSFFRSWGVFNNLSRQVSVTKIVSGATSWNICQRGSVDTEARFLAGDVSFARRNRIFLSPAPSLPERKKRILETVRKRGSRHQSCSEKTRSVVLNVTDVTLILFRAFPGGTKLD